MLSNGGTVSTGRTYGTYSAMLTSQVVLANGAEAHGADRLLYVGTKLKSFRDRVSGTEFNYAYDLQGRLERAWAQGSDAAAVVGSLAQRYDERYGFTDPSWSPGATSSCP